MGVIARHRSMEDWSVSLGNTLLASIVCLLWYVFGLWEEKDKVSEEASLTSAEKKVRSVDKEENFNNGSGHLCTSRTGGEGPPGRAGQAETRRDPVHDAAKRGKGSNCGRREEDNVNKKFGCQESGPNNVPVAAECQRVGVGKTNNLYGAFQRSGGQAEGSWDLQKWRQ